MYYFGFNICTFTSQSDCTHPFLNFVSNFESVKVHNQQARSLCVVC